MSNDINEYMMGMSAEEAKMWEEKVEDVLGEMTTAVAKTAYQEGRKEALQEVVPKLKELREWIGRNGKYADGRDMDQIISIEPEEVIQFIDKVLKEIENEEDK